jgi:tetratricopeptide (TPR) repeat protein
MKQSLKKRLWLTILITVASINAHCMPVWAYSDPELAKADKYIDSGQSSEAIAIVRKMIDEKKGPAEAFELYSLIMFFDSAHGVDAKAFACARDAARMNPRSAHILATFALMLCEKKKYEEGIKIIKRAFELNPKEARAHAIAAYLYKKVEDIPAANSQMEEALKLDSKSRDVNYLAGKFYWEEIEGNKVEDCYKRWLKYQPNSALAHYKTACYYNDLRRSEEAISECKKAIALNDKYMLARLLWQQIVFKQKRYKEAAELYTNFMKVCFQSSSTYWPRAQCYAALNEPQKAIDDFTKAINFISPTLAKEGLVKLGKHMSKHEKKDQIKLWIARSQQYTKMQNHKKAIEDMNLLVAAFPDNPSIIYAHAKALDAAKKYPEALKDANQLVALDTDVSQWLRFKADILKKMGREQEAKDVAKRADTLELNGK